MLAFKRVLKEGMKGPDAKAVKIGLKEVGLSKGLVLNRRFGPAEAADLRLFQKRKGLRADGVYGKSTHEQLSPHFTRYARWLYRRTKVEHPILQMTAREAASQLLAHARTGAYRDDRGGSELEQLRLTAKGQPVWNPVLGHHVYIDRRLLQAVLWLIEVEGLHIGTFALCTDHADGLVHGHGGGHAWDISSVDGVSIAAYTPVARSLTLRMAKILHSGMPKPLRPWQLICDGYGDHYDSSIAALTIPNVWEYGSAVMAEHRGHVHLGYWG